MPDEGDEEEVKFTDRFSHHYLHHYLQGTNRSSQTTPGTFICTCVPMLQDKAPPHADYVAPIRMHSTVAHVLFERGHVRASSRTRPEHAFLHTCSLQEYARVVDHVSAATALLCRTLQGGTTRGARIQNPQPSASALNPNPKAHLQA